MTTPASAAVRSILEHCDSYTWTTMGFGMIRTYLDPAKQWRLNIWDDRLQVPNVSTIHDHPWSFTSYVFCGSLNNTIYDVFTHSRTPMTHAYHSIKTGEGGGPVEKPNHCRLLAHPKLIYRAGSQYSQVLDVVHETSYERGTVTLNDRTPPTETYTARVFWPLGQEWVDAEPRRATPREVADAVEAALGLFKREAA